MRASACRASTLPVQTETQSLLRNSLWSPARSTGALLPVASWAAAGPAQSAAARSGRIRGRFIGLSQQRLFLRVEARTDAPVEHEAIALVLHGIGPRGDFSKSA